MQSRHDRADGAVASCRSGRWSLMHSLRADPSSAMRSGWRLPDQGGKELHREDDACLCRVPESSHTPLGLMDGLASKGVLQRSLSETSMSSVLGSPVTSEVSTGNSVHQQTSHSISAARRDHIERVFFQFTCPSKATVAIADLSMVIRFLGHSLPPDQLRKVAEEADEDGGGTLDFEEFLSMATKLDAARGAQTFGRSESGQSTNFSGGSASSSSSKLSSGNSGKTSRRELCKAVFMKCKSSEDVIETKDLGGALKIAGHNLTEAVVQAIAEEADDDRSGTLDEDEFVSLVEDLDRKAARHAEIIQIFARCKQADDVIAVTGLGKALRLVGHAFSEAEVDAIAQEADDDGSGTIDFDEFCSILEGLEGRHDARDSVKHSA